eukprot:s1206_g7.t7
MIASSNLDQADIVPRGTTNTEHVRCRYVACAYMASFECNICLEQAVEPVVTRCGHLFCWGCLHQWLNSTAASQASRAGQLNSGMSGMQTVGSACPICKASVTIQNVIPVYTRGSQTDPRNSYPNLPARPPGERPEPEPASVLALQAFQHGGTPESYGFTAGQGFYPVIFGLNWQGASLLEAPSSSKRFSFSILGLSLLYFLVFAPGEEDVGCLMSASDAAERLVAVAGSLRLRPAWLDQQRDQIGCNLSVEQAADRLLQRLAVADLRDACDGSLPRHLDRLHDIRVEGQHLLQMLQKVDIANPSAPEDSVEGDFQDGLAEEVSRRHGGRQRPLLLKVLLTDGIQAVCGIERRPIAALRQAIPGSKLVLGNRPLLRRGLLLLEPTNVEALCTLAQAGAVETLETAASSSGRDVAPQRSIASAASVAAGGAAAQQAGNVIRCYVAQAAPDAGRAGLWLQLCDGEGFCEALLQPPALQQTLGAGDLDSLLGRARQLHGFFRLVQTGDTFQIESFRDTFQIESFRLGPSRQDLEQLEQRLVAGAVETLETAASSSGRDVAPQRSIASAASVAAGGAAAQQAGNVSGAEGKAIRCYVAQAAPDAGAGDTFQIESFRRSPAAEELEMRLTDAPQIPYRDPNEGVLQSARNTVRR